MLLLATRPGGFTEVKRQKSKAGQKAVASNGRRIEGEHGRGSVEVTVWSILFSLSPSFPFVARTDVLACNYGESDWVTVLPDAACFSGGRKFHLFT